MTQSIEETLKERGARYGRFVDHAEVTTQLFKAAFLTLDGAQGRLSADQFEALHMIFHKIGRIIAGDPNYADSWHDIAGYAQLVADRLNGVER